MPQKSTDNYSASNIQILEGLEGVRKRPGMYIGSIGTKGLHHLVSEVVDNAIDEALAGYCTKIQVEIHPGEKISVQDNGRGIPTGIHAKEKRSALEVVMTTLHAGGKFSQDTYKVASGLHGVGLSCVNALSSYAKATVRRGGIIFEQTYEKGIPLSTVKEIGTTDETGTTIFFKPDETIFEVTAYQYDTIATRLRELAYLNPNLTITLTDLRTTNEEGLHRSDTFYAETGLKEYIAYLDHNREHILPETIYVETNQDNVVVEIALNYNTGHSEHIISYANNIHTFEGGTHLLGIKRGLTRAMKTYGEKSKIFERAKITPSGDNFREGITAVISVKLSDPQFSGQEKTRLTNSRIASLVDNAINNAMQVYLEENPKQAKLIMDKAILAAQASQAARRARDLIQRKTLLSSHNALPGKLADCPNKDPRVSEIFLLEGSSAAGISKQARNRNTQAILPLRGKILNIEKAQEYKMYESEPIRNIITALGVTFQDTEEGRITNIEKLRYHKIIIMTDADVDGRHIRTLLLTLFFRHMPELIQKGYVYIALPPLYLVKKGKNEHYCWDEKEREKAMADLATKGKGDIIVQRYKGLGEMNADQLWATTLNPETRVLKQVNIESAMEADRLFSVLMGDSIPLRRALIEKHSKEVDVVDIL